MSATAISSSTLTSILDSLSSTSTTKQLAREWKNLESALKSGDLTAAKTAFEAIEKQQGQQASQSGDTSSTSDATSTIANAMKALGTALDSGNVSAAQSAFANLQTVMKDGLTSLSQSSSSTTAKIEDAVIVDLLSELKSSSSTSTSSSSSSSATGSTLNVLA